MPDMYRTNPNEIQESQGSSPRKNLPPPDRIAPSAPWLDTLTRTLLELPDWVVVRIQRRGLLSIAEQSRYEAALMGFVPPGVPLHKGARFLVAAPAEGIQE